MSVSMALPASVPEWLRPAGLPTHRMPSAQALQRLVAGNVRYQRQRQGEGGPPGDAARASHPFALVVGCLEPGAAAEELFAERSGAVECIRTAGPSLGADTLAGIEYAALVQNVAVVLVLGHRGCTAVVAAVNAGRAGGLRLPDALAAWVSSAAAGGAEPDPVLGHVRALRARLRRADSLLSLTRNGQLTIAAGVLDPVTGAIDFLPDEPDEIVADAEVGSRPDPYRYGS